MRLRTLVLAGLAAVLALPAAATAKGPAEASISGPGLAGSIRIPGNGETMGTPLGNIVQSAGFFPLVFGQSPDPTTRARPAGELGPGFRIVYVVPVPDGVASHVTQVVYPYAKPTAVTYMRPGQKVWLGQQTRGGWFRAPEELKPSLVQVGLPATAPAPPGSGGFWWSPGSYAAVSAAVLLALVLLAWAAFALRRRERPVAAH